MLTQQGRACMALDAPRARGGKLTALPVVDVIGRDAVHKQRFMIFFLSDHHQALGHGVRRGLQLQTAGAPESDIRKGMHSLHARPLEGTDDTNAIPEAPEAALQTRDRSLCRPSPPFRSACKP